MQFAILQFSAPPVPTYIPALVHIRAAPLVLVQAETHLEKNCQSSDFVIGLLVFQLTNKLRSTRIINKVGLTIRLLNSHN